jgi:putative AlgH/UPF0301 family transcriptional regulator
MANSAIMPTLYRSLLRSAKRLDASPFSKALLVAQPAQLFDRTGGSIVTLPGLKGWSALLQSFNRGEFYRPESSALEAVRSSRGHFHRDPVDTALAAARSLGLAVAGGEALESLSFDYGSPSSVELVTSVRAAQPSTLRPGNLLLTHPVSCLKQPSLHHSVILIISADERAVSGVVLNKSLDRTLGAAVSPEMQEALGESLCAARLYKGGDVAERQLLLLHELPGLNNSTVVVDGLFATSSFDEVRQALDAYKSRDAEGAARSVASGQDDTPPSLPPRIKCVAGYAGWAREQLHAELERNVWFLAEAQDVAGLTMMEPNEGCDANWLRDAMWSGALAQLDHEYAALAHFPGDPKLVFSHMEQLWEDQHRLLHKRIDMSKMSFGEPTRWPQTERQGGGNKDPDDNDDRQGAPPDER